MSFKFEKLKVWQRAVEFTEAVDRVTKAFPKEELQVLTPQIKRAADSIALNIAEGSTGQSNPEFAKFLGYAIRSGIEVVTCLYIAQKRRLIDQTKFNDLYNEANEIIRMTQALRKTLK